MTRRRIEYERLCFEVSMPMLLLVIGKERIDGRSTMSLDPRRVLCLGLGKNRPEGRREKRCARFIDNVSRRLEAWMKNGQLMPVDSNLPSFES